MASQYSIAESDLTPRPLSATIYAQLTDDDGDGTTDVTILYIIEDAENEFNSYVGGMFTTAANIALAKPHVINVVVYHLHAGRQQNADYNIPESVVLRYKNALDWAKTTGKNLLAAEGTITPADHHNAEYTNDDDDLAGDHTMSKLDYL